MRFATIISWCLSILGVSYLFSVRYLIPRYLIPSIWALLDDTQQYLLTHAETIDASPRGNELRTDLETLSNQFREMRQESNRSQCVFQQVWLATRHCLTFRLCILFSRIKSIRRRAEMVVDEEQLASLAAPQSADSTESAAPAANTAIPIGDVAEPAPPPPAVCRDPRSAIHPLPSINHNLV